MASVSKALLRLFHLSTFLLFTTTTWPELDYMNTMLNVDFFFFFLFLLSGDTVSCFILRRWTDQMIKISEWVGGSERLRSESLSGNRVNSTPSSSPVSVCVNVCLCVWPIGTLYFRLINLLFSWLQTLKKTTLKSTVHDRWRLILKVCMNEIDIYTAHTHAPDPCTPTYDLRKLYTPKCPLWAFKEA